MYTLLLSRVPRTITYNSSSTCRGQAQHQHHCADKTSSASMSAWEESPEREWGRPAIRRRTRARDRWKAPRLVLVRGNVVDPDPGLRPQGRSPPSAQLQLFASIATPSRRAMIWRNLSRSKIEFAGDVHTSDSPLSRGRIQFHTGSALRHKQIFSQSSRHGAGPGRCLGVRIKGSY